MNDNLNRRQFIKIASTAVAATGCSGLCRLCAANREARIVDAGPLSRYAADGVYDQFLDDGFFVIRKGTKLFALSSICTHKKCKLAAESDRSFSCDCHGSTYDPSGKVTHGPANRDLPVLHTAGQNGHLLVSVPG